VGGGMNGAIAGGIVFGFYGGIMFKLLGFGHYPPPPQLKSHKELRGRKEREGGKKKTNCNLIPFTP